MGTANALYASLFAFCPNADVSSPSYKLQSVHAYLATAVPRPLTIMTTTFYSPGSPPRESIRSAVVTSTSLHASILHDSERLRAQYPSIERFKIAAQENISRWYSAKVKLLPLLEADPSGSRLLQYCIKESSFIPVDSYQADKLLDGPFSYFLSTANVDRLEPEFCITPLHARFPASSPCMDIVLIRPKRDASLEMLENPNEAFSAKVGKVLGGAYTAGSHVDMVHDGQGGVKKAETEEEGLPVVEYFRCGGWEWTPVKTRLEPHGIAS
jgi:hypothetical protein